MKRIKQDGDRDCGVAALAMLAGVTLAEARKCLEKNGFKAKGVKAKAIVAGLRHYGRKPVRDRSTRISQIDFNDLNYDALLSCYMWIGKERFGHWAVWDAAGRRVLDPWKKNQRLQIRTYLPIAAA